MLRCRPSYVKRSPRDIKLKKTAKLFEFQNVVRGIFDLSDNRLWSVIRLGVLMQSLCDDLTFEAAISRKIENVRRTVLRVNKVHASHLRFIRYLSKKRKNEMLLFAR